jgi:Flp pilus assembly pilin Flp
VGLLRFPFVSHLTRLTKEEGGMKNLPKFLWQDQKGQDLTEYALLLALIALGAIVSMKTIASTINGAFSNAASKIAAP